MRKKDVEGLSGEFEVYKSLHRIMSDVAMLLMSDAKLMIFYVKPLLGFLLMLF